MMLQHSATCWYVSTYLKSMDMVYKMYTTKSVYINQKKYQSDSEAKFYHHALGPILPQLNVYGRQLGVSAEVMGYVTAGLPLLWAAAKPAFGYVVDYWPNHRKLVFMFLIIIMTGSYCGLWFIPAPEIPPDISNKTISLEYIQHVYKMNDTVYLQSYEKIDPEFVEKFKCHWSCARDHNFEVYLANTTYINTIYTDTSQNISCDAYEMDFDNYRNGIGVTCTPKADCNLLCFENEDLAETFSNKTKREHNIIDLNSNATLDSIFKPEDVSKYKTVVESNLERNPKDNLTIENNNNLQNVTDENGVSTADNAKSIDISKEPLGHQDILAKISKVVHIVPEEEGGGSFYVSAAFWSFVILMCVGTVAFNVANCIGDAVCFDVLGPENGSKYGAQRAWGTAGYGVTAFLGGWLVDMVSAGSATKDFTPAFVLALVATAVDLFSCRRLKLPSLSSPDDSGKALREVLKIPRVVVFICFAVVAGVFDSFIIYYMFWFLEDIAEQTGHQGKIKLIEGIIVAGQSFIGEIVFFALSGKIIKRWGYGTTLTLSLFCYGIRMALISLIQNPWHLIPIESIMQGPTYALCYSTIVGYAAHVAPEGYSATVQGIVAGMDDGVGFALGSLVGGQLYGWAGGRASFRILALTAGVGSLLHAALFALVTRKKSFALGSLVGGQLYGWAGGRASFRILALTAGVGSLLHAALFALVTRKKRFALGSLVGGQLYGWAGGRASFRILALTAGVGSLLHAALFALVTRKKRFALGSLVGGQLYGWAGGRASFRILALTAGVGSLLHAALFALVTRKKRFALGSLVGGQLYGWAGGRASFRILALTAGVGSLLHAALFALVTRKKRFALGSLVGGQLYGWAGGRASFRILALTAGVGSLLHAALFALVTRKKRFALGSLVGGQLYGWAGGRASFRILALTAGGGSLLHAALFALVTRKILEPPSSEPPEEGEKMLPIPPETRSSDIYRDTVVPVSEKNDR